MVSCIDMTSDFDQTGLLTAHKNYIIGQSFLLKNDPSRALAYFHKSQQLFKKELNTTLTFPNQELWQTELNVLEQTLMALQTDGNEINSSINLNTYLKDNSNDLITSMRALSISGCLWPNKIAPFPIK